MTSHQIIPGSINAIAQQSGKSIAETFVSADLIVIVDTSGSMGAKDSTGGQSRYEVACRELANLQASLPGKIAVLSFSDDVQFCPSGVPVFLMGGTKLEKALSFAKIADIGKMRFILISDGQPDDEQAAIQISRTYKNKIDVIYVGPETDRSAREFMNRLAASTGGQTVTADKAKELSSKITYLLSTHSSGTGA
jgi:hypothetical protein